MIALAIRTGIAPEVWAEQGERGIATAVAILNGVDDDRGPGPQMSG